MVSLVTWSEDDLRRAFVDGVAWWECHSQMATLWPSDRDETEAEAERRYPDGHLPDKGAAAFQEPASVATDYYRAGLLACTVCYKILPVNEMYSVDACSERCQSKICQEK